MRQSPLQQWLDAELSHVALPGLTPAIAVSVGKALMLIAAFGFFASIADQWIVTGQPADSLITAGLAIMLTGHWILEGIGQRLAHRLRTRQLYILEQCFSQQLMLRQHALVRTRPVYHWQLVWQKHIPAIVNWRTDYCVQQYVAVIVPLIALTVIFYMNYFIGAMLLLTLPVVPLFMIVVGKGAAYLHRREFTALTRLGSLFSDRLMALPVLAGTGAHVVQQQHLKDASLALNIRTMKVVSVAFLSSTVLDFFSTLAVALIAVYIGFSLLGELQLGPQVTFFSGLWVLLTTPLLLSQLKKLGQFYHQKAQAEAASEALAGLLGTTVMDKSTPEIFSGFSASDFTMQMPLLKAKELRITPGDWVQVTGVSGAGKTALLEALAGFRQASHKLAGRAVLLTQQPAFLPGTLRENLCLGYAYPDSQLYHKLQQVGLGSAISNLPAGLDTLMGDVPALSGGELQRLAIARLLLRDAQVWLLDEPTAHLPEDQHTNICRLIRHCCQDKTVIWVSHKSLKKDWFSAIWHIEDQHIRQVQENI